MQITRKHIINTIIVSAMAGAVTQLISLFIIPIFIDNLGEDLYGI